MIKQTVHLILLVVFAVQHIGSASAQADAAAVVRDQPVVLYGQATDGNFGGAETSWCENGPCGIKSVTFSRNTSDSKCNPLSREVVAYINDCFAELIAAEKYLEAELLAKRVVTEYSYSISHNKPEPLQPSLTVEMLKRWQERFPMEMKPPLYNP